MPDPCPARGRPARVVLAGERVRLEPLDADRHAAALYHAADESTWEFLPYGPFEDEAAFRAHIAAQASSEDPLFFAVGDAGVASMMRIEPAHGCIEIGHIRFGAPLRRTAAATEAIFLLARHAFDDLGYRRLEWKCDAANGRSRRAAERFGFTYEGTFRQHLIVNGRNRDTAWYSILDGEWPAVRRAFEAWLAPENFDAGGRQISTLEQLRGSLRQRGAGEAEEPDAEREQRHADGGDHHAVQHSGAAGGSALGAQ